MVKTTIGKGDKVVILRGEGSGVLDETTKKRVVCTVLEVDRVKGRALLEMPRPKAKRGERQTPLRGVEQWKTARYNQKTGEAGGLKIAKRPVHLSNLRVVEQAPRREFGKNE
jgi:ribosomal protein L24